MEREHVFVVAQLPVVATALTSRDHDEFIKAGTAHIAYAKVADEGRDFEISGQVVERPATLNKPDARNAYARAHLALA